jgi:hypothetical protein
MGFKIKSMNKGSEVKIYRSDNPELVGKFGIIQRISISRSVAYLKLTTGEEVEVPLNNLVIA